MEHNSKSKMRTTTIVKNDDPSGQSCTQKKNTKRWTLSGLLFKKSRNKSSDTDCSSSDSSNCKKKGFLGRKKSVRKKNGGSHRVVGKFESIKIPAQKNVNNISDSILDNLEKYETSPNTMNHRRLFYTGIYNNVPAGVSQSNQEMTLTYIDPEFVVNSSTGSLTKVDEKQKLKARVEALRDRLCNSSSDGEEYLSSKNSNSSTLQRGIRSSEDSSGKINSLSKKSRASRTDRYIKRHYRGGVDFEDPTKLIDKNNFSMSGCNKNHVKFNFERRPITDPRQVISATSSPVSSPPPRLKSFLIHQTRSLPSKSELPTLNHKTAVTYDLKPEDRSSSWPDNEAYLPNINSDTNFRDSKQHKRRSLSQTARSSPLASVPHRKVKTGTEFHDYENVSVYNNVSPSRKEAVCNNGDYGKIRSKVCKHQSNSDQDISKYSLGSLGQGQEQMSHRRSKYSAEVSPRSRKPIQIISQQEPDNVQFSPKSYLKSNGICHQSKVGNGSTDYTGCEFNRPLSMVLERSENEQPSSYSENEKLCSCDKKMNVEYGKERIKRKSSNLEDALKELEEIYDSLRLSDEELLERADRRERNLSRCRYSWSNLNGYQTDHYPSSSNNGNRYSSSLEFLHFDDENCPLHGTKKSLIPDKVADDMAFRKLNKNQIQDPKSTCNVVSQSGSFLLISPTLSPPEFKYVPPPPVDNEPDITLDDVVFRNIRQANNTLKITDPQPPFGIPLGPVSSAADSDYLHAVPRNIYRSSFRPRRNPDIVTDDLAFRALRKDIQSPICACKIPKALKSSANTGTSYNLASSGKTYRINKKDSEIFFEKPKYGSYNKNFNPPDMLVKNANNRSIISVDFNLKSPNELSTHERELSVMATEAKIVSRELKQILRELEAIPKKKKLFEDDENEFCKPSQEKEIFTGKIVHHKPITLSQFKIPDSGLVEENDEFSKNSKKIENQNNILTIDSDDSSSNNNYYVKEVCENASRLSFFSSYPDEIIINNIPDQNKSENFEKKNSDNKELQNSDDVSLKSICDSFNWDNIKLICTQSNGSLNEFKDRNNNRNKKSISSSNMNNCNTRNSKNSLHSENGTDSSKSTCRIVSLIKKPNINNSNDGEISDINNRLLVDSNGCLSSSNLCSSAGRNFVHCSSIKKCERNDNMSLLASAGM